MCHLTAGLPGAYASSLAWGDYDNDGDLDVLLAGYSLTEGYVADVYRNDGGGLAGVSAGLEPVSDASVAWGDYDGDGDLDILLAGYNASDVATSTVYRNTGAGFTDAAAGLEGLGGGSAAWGDYDNDGDLDILLTGYNASDQPTSMVYRNDGAGFTAIAAGLEGVGAGSAAWGDYDNDGDLDILLTGYNAVIEPTSALYRNDAGGFTDVTAGFEGVGDSSAAWGDYDNDGDLDVLLTGYNGSFQPTSTVYRNDPGGFADIGAALTGVSYSSAAWGDYDNDGDLDILLTGYSPSAEPTSKVYRNAGGTFTDVGAALTGLDSGSAAWGDYDDDGDLDILLTGRNASWDTVTHVYVTDGPANTAPLPPTNLAAATAGDVVTLSWSATADAETPPAGLTYNVRVGTSSGAGDVVAPMADLVTGQRRLAAMGNAQQTISHPLLLPLAGTYYWSVQAVDTAFAGSNWADEQTITIGGQPEIDVTDSSGAPDDASIRFMTALSDFDPAATDSPLVRPAYPDVKQYFEVENIGTGALTITEIQINAQDVTLAVPPPGDVVLEPGETQRFDLIYDPSVPTTRDPTTQDFDLDDGVIIHSDAANDDEFALALHGDSTYDSDISYDGQVNLAELGRLNANFGKTVGDTDFDPTADIDGDGVVNLADLGPLNAQFGLNRLGSTSAPAQTAAASPSAADAPPAPAAPPPAVQDASPAQEHLAAAAMMSETDDDEDEPASAHPAVDLGILDNTDVAPPTPEVVTSPQAAGHPTLPVDLAQAVESPSARDADLLDVLQDLATTFESGTI